jgi:hypothetical protein
MSVRQCREHDVAVKAQHGVAAVQCVRRGGVFPHHVGAAQRSDGLRVMRVRRAMQALEKLAREWRIDDLWHGVLLSIMLTARHGQGGSCLCKSMTISRCRRRRALTPVSVCGTGT